MTNLLYELFGDGNDLTALQMSMRSIVIFVVALALIRVAGIRAFGKRSSFDNVVTIMLGAVLSRAVVGASGFVPTVCASLVMVGMHRIIGMATITPSRFSKLIKSEHCLLFKDGKPLYANMKKVQISLQDMEEAVRKELHQETFDKVRKIYIERDGTLAIITKDNE